MFGVAYVCSWITPIPRILAIIVALIGGLGTTLSNLTQIYWGSWFTQALFNAEIVGNSYYYPSEEQSIRNYMAISGWHFNGYYEAIYILVIIGSFLRLLAFVCMHLTVLRKH